MIKQYLIFGFLICFLWTNPGQAVYVCATKTLSNKDMAASDCTDVCRNYNADYMWFGDWFPHKEEKVCKDTSVCECSLQSCSCDQDGKQSSNCDEARNKLGPNKCTSDCDCVKGRICIDGWCKAKPAKTQDSECCYQCHLKAACWKCSVSDTACLIRCELVWATCKKDCPEGCPYTPPQKK